MFKLLCGVIILVCKARAVHVDENSILLYFYSYNNSNINTSIPLNRSNWKIAELNTTADIKVIIHGYKFNHKHSIAQDLINAFLLSKEHSNIIFLDWGKYSVLNYYNASSLKEEIAEIMTNDLISLAKVNKLSLSKFHLIGTSFGAHLSGLIGQQIYNKTGSKLNRITGLDPVGPLFFGLSKNSRLDASDAIFVDVIHTCASIGYFQPCGTIDFWPNGGQIQRGCDFFTTCSHNRAIEYYIESINSKNFTAWECYNYELFNKGLCEEGHCVVMGEHVDTAAKGQYFLHTHEKPPYACNC